MSNKNASQEQFKQTLQYVQKQIDNNAQLKWIEAQTSVPRLYIATALTVIVLIMVFFNFGGGFITNIIGFVYPAYASFKAIESKETTDDTKWLTYWVVYAFFNILEHFTDLLLFWLPFYFFFKLSFLIYLISEHTNGAEYVYKTFIRQFFIQNEAKFDQGISQIKSQVGQAVNQAVSAAAEAAVEHSGEIAAVAQGLKDKGNTKKEE